MALEVADQAAAQLASEGVLVDPEEAVMAAKRTSSSRGEDRTYLRR